MSNTLINNMKLARKSSIDLPYKLLHRRNSISGPCHAEDTIYHHPKLDFDREEQYLNSLGELSMNPTHNISNPNTSHLHSKTLSAPPSRKSHNRSNSFTEKISNYFPSSKQIHEHQINEISNYNNQSRRFSLDLNQIRDQNKQIHEQEQLQILQEQQQHSHPEAENIIHKVEVLESQKRNVITHEKFILEKKLEKEANLIFQSCWSNLVKLYGLDNLQFPNEVLFLIGAPGAGKDTNTDYIRESLGIDSKPIVMSSFLNSKECIEIKSKGGLVDDKVVFELLLKEIARPNSTGEGIGSTFRKSIIIDGFPRSKKQAKLVELLYEKLCWLKKEINPNSETKPIFRISVLHVSEDESVNRQLNRGKHAIKENQNREAKNLPLLEIRDTDINPESSKKRYQIYSEQYDSLKSLADSFNFNEINANGSRDDVRLKIQQIYSKPTNISNDFKSYNPDNPHRQHQLQQQYSQYIS